MPEPVSDIQHEVGVFGDPLAERRQAGVDLREDTLASDIDGLHRAFRGERPHEQRQTVPFRFGRARGDHLLRATRRREQIEQGGGREARLALSIVEGIGRRPRRCSEYREQRAGACG